MIEKVQEHLNEVIKLAERCPEKYQVSCFEILLSLVTQSGVSRKMMAGPLPGPEDGGKPDTTKPTFITQYEITPHVLSRIFYQDGESYTIIARDLKAKPVAQKQLRLALLLGVQKLLSGSEPTVSKEQLVETCKRYAAYDSANFASTMKKHRNLLLPKGNEWLITVPGEEQAAELIKELAQ